MFFFSSFDLQIYHAKTLWSPKHSNSSPILNSGKPENHTTEHKLIHKPFRHFHPHPLLLRLYQPHFQINLGIASNTNGQALHHPTQTLTNPHQHCTHIYGIKWARIGYRVSNSASSCFLISYLFHHIPTSISTPFLFFFSPPFLFLVFLACTL